MVRFHETHRIMESKELKEFKKNVGQSNHYLITSLIGLDAVQNGYQKPSYLDSKWNPKDLGNTVNRTRLFIYKSAMSWIVDNLDAYFCEITKVLLKINPDSNYVHNLDYKNKHSVFNQFKNFIDTFNSDFLIEDWAYVDMLIQWRNNLTHKNAKNPLTQESKTFFVNNKSGIIKDYYGNQIDIHLDTKKLFDDFDKNEAITFKDIATIISKTIQFITKLDELLMKTISSSDYFNFYIYKLEKESKKLNTEKTELYKVFNHIKGDETKAGKLKRYMQCHGFPESKYTEVIDWIHSIENLSYEEYIDKINNKFKTSENINVS